MSIYNKILDKYSRGEKQIAILIDPDKTDHKYIDDLVIKCMSAGVDFLFVGGSLLTNGQLPEVVKQIKSATDIPLVLFPGDSMQIDASADALLFLSLISGRNPDLLIGKHISAAPIIRENKLEAISTGYMLIESGNTTTALYMSNTHPIPHDKDDIAACTAMAGEMLGLKMIFMDAGSGANNPVSLSMIKTVKSSISIPLIVGGGIRTVDKAVSNCRAGADIIVVGNSIENDFDLIHELTRSVHSVQPAHHV